MLKPPRLGGADQLRLFVDELTFPRACQVLEVHPATLRRWLRDDPPPPPAAMQALYWLTSWGYADACAETDWTHQLLQRELERLRALRDWHAPWHWQAANDARMGLHLVEDRA